MSQAGQRQFSPFNQQRSMDVIDWDIWASEAEITPGSAYLLCSSPRFCASYGINTAVCLCISTVHFKGFASGITMIMLTGAPGAPGGPKIAPPLWKDIFIQFYNMGQTDSNYMTGGISPCNQWIVMTSHFRSLYLQLVQAAHPVAFHGRHNLKHNQQ